MAVAWLRFVVTLVVLFGLPITLCCGGPLVALGGLVATCILYRWTLFPAAQREMTAAQRGEPNPEK